MASLADELDLDPAFDDANFGNGGGVPMSFDEEKAEQNSIEETPPRARGGRRGRGAGRRGGGSGYDSDDANEQDVSTLGTLGGTGEGFSLADELGGGKAQLANGSSLAENSDGDYGDRIAEDVHTRAQRLDDETKARKDQEHYLVSSEILTNSQITTETFLQKLKKTSGVSSAGGGSLSMPSSTSTTSIHVGGPSADDTSTLEGRAGNVLKQMREYSSAREDQIRELQECDRILRRAFEEGGDWMTALANVDDFEGEEFRPKIEEDGGLSFISSMQSYKRQSRREGSTASAEVTNVKGALIEEEEEEEDDSYQVNSSASLARSPLSPISMNEQQMRDQTSTSESSKPSVCQQLASLQTSTSDLVLSLGSIHEQSQMARASMNDAARRIRTIKTVLTNWNLELQEVEQSQSRITSWESGEDSESRPKDIQEWTQSHLDKFQRVLNDADIRARELLSPIHDPVLDRLAAQG